MKKTTGMEKEIAEEINGLPAEEHVKILEIVRRMKTRLGKKHSVYELRGCGKNIWKGIDGQDYVNKLRSEWN